MSYPRSGSTYLRPLLERVFGIYTGSDTSPRKDLSEQLRVFGMAGEGVVDSSVLVVKSHYPERRGVIPFTASAVIVLVRSPLCAFDSFFNMYLTRTHNMSIDELQFAPLVEVWNDFLHSEAIVWRRFHDHWLSEASRGVPTLTVCYEDLLHRLPRVLPSIVEFIVAALTDTAAGMPELKEIHERMSHLLAADAASARRARGSVRGLTGPYRPRAATVSPSSVLAAGRIGPLQVSEVLEAAGGPAFLARLGYNLLGERLALGVTRLRSLMVGGNTEHAHTASAARAVHKLLSSPAAATSQLNAPALVDEFQAGPLRATIPGAALFADSSFAALRERFFWRAR